MRTGHIQTEIRVTFAAIDNDENIYPGKTIGWTTNRFTIKELERAFREIMERRNESLVEAIQTANEGVPDG